MVGELLSMSLQFQYHFIFLFPSISVALSKRMERVHIVFDVSGRMKGYMLNIQALQLCINSFHYATKYCSGILLRFMHMNEFIILKPFQCIIYFCVSHFSSKLASLFLISDSQSNIIIALGDFWLRDWYNERNKKKKAQ